VGRAVDVHKSFANPDKLRHAGSNEEEGDIIHDFVRIMDQRPTTKANAKGASAVADAAAKNEPKRRPYRERVNGGAYWIAVMVAQGLGAPPPDYREYGFTEAPTQPDWYRDAADSQRDAGYDNATTGFGSRNQSTPLAAALADLGLLEGSTLAEVRKAYRELVKVIHPDRGGSEAACVKVNAAYAIVLKLMTTA
jgi:hypothetical protein